MTTIAAYLKDNPNIRQTTHYELSNEYSAALKDIGNYPGGTLLTVNDCSTIVREFSGASVILQHKNMYPLEVCFKFVNEVPDYFMIGDNEEGINKHTKTIINKQDCYGFITKWFDITPVVNVGKQYKITINKGNNLEKVIVKYGIIRDELLDQTCCDLIAKYQLSDKERDVFILQNMESLRFAANHDYLDMFQYLLPKVMPNIAPEYTPYDIETLLETAVNNDSINISKYLLGQYKPFTNIETCLKYAARNENSDMTALLFLHKIRNETNKPAFNLYIRDGLNPN